MRHSKQRPTKGATINWSINFFVEDIMDFEFFSEGGTFKGVSLIYSRKGVGPEMEPEKHALTNTLTKVSYSEPPEAVYY